MSHKAQKPPVRSISNSNIQYHRAEIDDTAQNGIREDEVASEVSPALSMREALQQVDDSERQPSLEPQQSTTRFQGAFRQYDRLTSDHWTYELLGVLLCAATLVSIVAILFSSDGKPTPDSVGGVSLNTVISVLATISRAAAVLLATSVIAQQKWLRYRENSRSMIEVLLYEDATRGPLGSLYLLGTLRVGFLSALAASVAVLALGFEPFVQQAVRYPLRDQVSITMTQPLIQTVQNVTFEDQQDMNLTQAFYNAITQGLYAEAVRPLQLPCDGNACDWPKYRSVAFCASCRDALSDAVVQPSRDDALLAYTKNDLLNTFRPEDLTEELGTLTRSSNTTYNISLGEGDGYIFDMRAEASVQAAFSSITSSISYPETVIWNLYQSSTQIGSGAWQWSNYTINDVTGPLKAYGCMKLAPANDGSRLEVKSAQRCVISFCAQQYSSTYREGTVQTVVDKQEWGLFHSIFGIRNAIFKNWTADLEDTHFQGGYFNLSNSILHAAQQPLIRFEGAVMATETRYYSDDEPLVRITNPDPDVMLFMSDVENNTAKIAQSLTNLIQSNGDSFIEGTVYESKPFVEVRWIWLLYPAVLVVIAVVALIATMVQTKSHGLPTWKSSPFPLLYNYHDRSKCSSDGESGSDAFIPETQTTSSHNEAARQTQLRLRSTGESWVFDGYPRTQAESELLQRQEAKGTTISLKTFRRRRVASRSPQ